MDSMNLTPQEKLERGLPLTAEDSAQLRKNPNNWIAQLYAECLAIAAIEDYAFDRYVEAIMQEEREYARAEAEDERFAEARAEARKQLLTTSLPATKSIPEKAENFKKAGIPINTVQTILKNQMTTVLAVSQARMKSTQLIDHHQKLTANLSNQLSAQLGTTITLDNGQTLGVPQLSFTPAHSIGEVMTHNPAFADMMLADTTPEIQNDLINVFAQGELIRLAIRKAQEIREANPDKELTVKDRIDLQEKADKKLHEMLNFNTTTKKYDNPIANKLTENALYLQKTCRNLNIMTHADITGIGFSIAF